jgi:hypothetical protein
MATEARDILLRARLVDLYRRKTEAEFMGQSTVAYEALIEIYRMELDEIEASQWANRNVA